MDNHRPVCVEDGGRVWYICRGIHVHSESIHKQAYTLSHTKRAENEKGRTESKPAMVCIRTSRSMRL